MYFASEMTQTAENRYRPLRSEEIEQLRANGCHAEDWDLVCVADGFCAANIRNCRFKGRVNIGSNVTIEEVGSYICNYTIGDQATIIGVGVMECSTEGSTFGNGIEVATINENGGRSVKIYDTLSAQVAYIQALYRHRPKTIEALNQIADRYTDSVRSSMGSVGEGATVTDCRIIRNTNIGPKANVVGASLLSNGTILSSAEAPAKVGIDVKLYDFIAAEGCHIDNGSLMRRCYIGQSVIIENLTAADSLFFANSHLENGEACSIFAGPFTVSHHASSLLIAGMFSFFNAGSGTNQSNHLFRTGAVHQGIHARGVKYGSNAYAMLPCTDGAFTVVIGRHYNHPNTDDFPYSYIMNKHGHTWLMPARNLTSYGTVRDLTKWVGRDKRKGEKRDIIHFQECTPYVGERFLRAIRILSSLLADDDDTPEVINWSRMKISRQAAINGLRLYRMAADKYIGYCLEGENNQNLSGRGGWIDCAGEFMTSERMNSLLNDIEDGTLNTPEAISAELKHIADDYDSHAYDWAVGALEQRLARKVTAEDIAEAIERGTRAAGKLCEMTEADRLKDYDEIAQISYGIDSLLEQERIEDFVAVRGKA